MGPVWHTKHTNYNATVPLGTSGKQASGFRIEDTSWSGRSDSEVFASILSHPKSFSTKALMIFSCNFSLGERERESVCVRERESESVSE